MNNRLARLLLICLFVVSSIPSLVWAEPLSPAGKAFLKDAASFNLMEMQLGQLARDKAVAPEVKDYGNRMVLDHGNSNQELKAIAARKNLKLPAQVARRHALVIASVSDDSGTDFDRGYLKAMVKTHSKAVTLLKKALRKVEDADLQAWAKVRLPAVQEHLRQANDLTLKLQRR